MKKLEIFTTDKGNLAFYVYQVMKTSSSCGLPLPLLTYSSDESAQHYCDLFNQDIDAEKDGDELLYVHRELVLI